MVMTARVQKMSANRLLLQMVTLPFLILAFFIIGVHTCKTTLDIDVDWHAYYLTSPNYPLPAPRNEDMCWRLSVNQSYDQDGYVIRLMVEDAVLGMSKPCSTEDNVVIYNGGSTSFSELRQLCNRDEPGDVRSTGSQLLVRFRTPSSIGGRGFKLSYWAEPKLPAMPGNIDCTPILINATNETKSEVFLSHSKKEGNTSMFSPTDACWNIQTGRNRDHIHVHSLIVLVTTRASSWLPIFIDIYDGSTSTSPILLKTSTRNKDELAQTNAYSTTSQIYMRLHMAINNVYYRLLNIRRLVAVKISFTSVPGKEMKQKAEMCSMELLQGVIPYVFKSPQYPLQTYAPYDHCWLFNVTGYVCLRLVDFYVEASAGCEKNFLEIRQGTNIMTSTLLHRWCGVVDPDDVGLVCVNQSALIKYHVEDLPTKGFSMQLYKVDYAEPPRHPCTTLLASNRAQILESPGYSNTSEEETDLCWVIKTGSPLTIVHVEMIDYIPHKTCLFHLSVRDGNSTVAPLLSNKCESEPRYYRSAGTQLYLSYESTTELKVRKGFRLRFMEIQRVSTELKCEDIIAKSGSLQADIEFPTYFGRFGGNYSSNRDVCWRIRGKTFGRVLLFKKWKFELEGSSGCTKDYMEILDGSSSLDPVLWRGCGSSFPRGLVTKTPYAMVRFHSDQDINAKGFVIYIDGNEQPEIPCQKLYATDAAQLLRAPSFQRHKKFCWIVQAEKEDNIVYVEVNSLRFGFCKASLYIRDGNVSHAKLLLEGCPSTPRSHGSTSRYMYIQYKTRSTGDSSFEFLLRFYQVPKAFLQQNITKIRLGYRPGRLISPNYPGNYPNDLDMCWLVTSSVPYKKPVIEVSVSQLEESPGCLNDYIEVRDGPTSRGVIIKRWCGNTVPKPLLLSRQYALICFHSNSAINQKGFEMTVYAGARGEKRCTKTVELTASTRAQYITSPGYPSTYKANLTLCWKIIVPSYLKNLRRKIYIEVESIDLEPDKTCSYDYIAIRDVSRFSNRAKWCGNDSETSRAARSRWDRMYVIFITDFTKNYKGFKLRYWLFGNRCKRHMALLDKSRELSSPGYPTESRNIDMCWTIRRPLFKKLRLKVTDLKLSGNCSTNFLEVREGETLHSKLITRLCGDTSLVPNKTKAITIMSDSMYIRIRFQAGNIAGRFAAKYQLQGVTRDYGLSKGHIISIVLSAVGALLTLLGGCCGAAKYKKREQHTEPSTEMNGIRAENYSPLAK